MHGDPVQPSFLSVSEGTSDFDIEAFVGCRGRGEVRSAWNLATKGRVVSTGCYPQRGRGCSAAAKRKADQRERDGSESSRSRRDYLMPTT